jgi:aspartyl-tRNA(Asn)/glutamyl-tRNA(Gln) amidotransferase subunit A
MHNKTIREMADDLAAGRYTSVELTQHFINRIHAHDKSLNSFITVTDELALKQAHDADMLHKAGKAGPLTGIPIAQKDIFCTKGVKTSCGSKMLDNFIAPYNATVIEKFEAAGAVMLGKTNMDEFAMGSSNENSFYGPVRNPWNLDCVPGGSSGGSAAAVAGGLAPAATGTDTGGSIRQPAALTGITGLKPTYGRVSRYGMIAYASSLDQGGPMTKTAYDAAMLLNVMAGHDPRDSTSINIPVPDYTAGLDKPLHPLKVGLPSAFFDERLNPEIAACLEEAKKVLAPMGVTFHPVTLNTLDLSIPAYYVIAPAECSSNLSRYDGVRFGHRCENPKNLQDLYERSREEGFGSEVKRRIMIGTYALSAGYFDAYYLKALKVRRLIANDFARAFETVDVIMSPTTPSTAFKIGEKSNDPVAMYLSDIYTIAVNLAGLPGMSIPCGFVNGLPVGMQLIGKAFDEKTILHLAHQYQMNTDWHNKEPK